MGLTREIWGCNGKLRNRTGITTVLTGLIAKLTAGYFECTLFVLFNDGERPNDITRKMLENGNEGDRWGNFPGQTAAIPGGRLEAAYRGAAAAA